MMKQGMQLLALTILVGGVNAETLQWEFNVFLGDRAIGQHQFTIQREGNLLELRTEASFNVKFLFLTAYTYRHQNTEIWDSAGLVRIDAYTDANGDVYDIEGNRDAGGFSLNSSGERKRLPANLMTFAYWNPNILSQSRLLNSQTGKYEPVRVVDRGEDTVPFEGRTIPARKYDLLLENGAMITLWYALEDDRWVALESITETGRLLRYVPVRLPESSAYLTSFPGE